ncbi:MAG: dUTP diphosphatase [Candidatus Yonathbacteria bacterium]|nr:dUTP diphosphatase [Candidatus Yonathbacteria bacterium]
MLTVKIKKLKPEAVLPSYAHAGDAGMDIYTSEDVHIRKGERGKVPTGIAMEIPDGYVGLVWDKSGLSMNHGLKTLGGVIDAGYRGEIMIGIANLSNEDYTLEKGHKVAQILFQKIESPTVQEVAELVGSSRGVKGFGSTGK